MKNYKLFIKKQNNLKYNYYKKYSIKLNLKNNINKMIEHPLTNKPLKKGKTLLLFDIDGTLTKARSVIEDDMIDFLKDVIEKNPNITLASVGGAEYVQVKYQIGKVASIFKLLCTENGVSTYDSNLNLVHSKKITDYLTEEQIQEMINFGLIYIANLKIPIKRGSFIQFRDSTINFSPIGRDCSPEERTKFMEYDKEHHILKKFKEEFDKLFEKKFNVHSVIGGQISFDLFPNGWDKRYCLQFFKDYDNIIFFGDKTNVGGNDYSIAVCDGITRGIHVDDPEDTKIQVNRIIKEIKELEEK